MARHDAPFIVKRIAPMIGRPDSARRVSIEGRAYTLAHAIEIAGEHVRRRVALEATVAREGDVGGWRRETIRELTRKATWIERRGSPATGGRGTP